MKPRSGPGLLFLSLASSATLLMLVLPQVARADGDDPAAAESLFQEARKLMDAGNYSEACPKFVASQKASPAVGTLLNLAACYEKAGLTASAWARYREAITAAQRAGRADREKTARDRANKLEPKLPRLTITSKTTGIEVRRDDVTVDEGALGSAVPVDPGSHTITARAPGKKTWTKSLTITEAQSQTVAIPALVDEEKKEATASPSSSSSGTSTSSSSNAQSGGGGMRTASYVVMGAGVVGIGVGSYFGLQTFSTWSDAQKHCTGSQCDPTGVKLAGDANSQGTISTIGFVAGGALLVGGAVLFFMSSPSGGKLGWLVPDVGPSYAGVALGGRM